MSIVRKVMNIFNKVDYDHNRPDINAYNYHPQLRILLASAGLFFGNRTTCLRWVLPIYSLIITIGGLILEGTSMWHGIMVKDYGFATECFSYCALWGTSVMLYISVFKNADEIINLAEDMNKLFIEICALGSRYRVEFLKTQALIWKLSLGWCTFVFIVLKFFVAYPALQILYQNLFQRQEVHEERLFPLSMWFPLPYNESPYYETFFILQIFMSYACGHAQSVYITFMIHVFLNYHALMDMIILDLEVIFEGLDESVALLPPTDRRYIHARKTLAARFKRIVLWHQQIFKVVKDVSSIFGPPLVYQVMGSPTAICVMAFDVAHKMENGEIDHFFIVLVLATLVQIWVPCHLGAMISDKALDIGDACWNCGWEKTSLTRIIRQDIIIFILRCQIPVSIKFVGLPKLDLETFSLIVTRAYSLFNMLRQYSAIENNN